MKIKIKAKSDPCNCKGNAGSGCTNERKGEAPIDKRWAWVGASLLFVSVAIFLGIFVAGIVIATEDLFSLSNLLNLAQAFEVSGLIFFGIAMARWRA